MAHVHKIHTLHPQDCTLMPVGNADQTFTGTPHFCSPVQALDFSSYQMMRYKISLPQFRVLHKFLQHSAKAPPKKVVLA